MTPSPLRGSSRLVTGSFLFLLSLAALAANPAHRPVLGTEPSPHDGPLNLRLGAATVLALSTTGPKPYPLFVRPSRARPVTRRFPMIKDHPGETRDHPHQRGVWFAHGDLIVAGQKPTVPLPGVAGFDFWSEGLGRGRIEVQSHQADADRIILEIRWLCPMGTELLRERQTWSVAAVGTDLLIRFETELRAGAAAVTFGDTKEGTFGLRLCEDLTAKRGGQMTNSQGGRGEAGCWGRTADWVHVQGTIDTEEVGLALFDDPRNEPRAAWHVRGYGLLAANPFGRARSGFPDRKEAGPPLELAAGASLRLRYGIYVHRGKADRVADAFATFCKPER